MSKNDAATIERAKNISVEILNSKNPNEVSFRFPGGNGEVVIRKNTYFNVASKFTNGTIEIRVLDDELKAKNPLAGAAFIGKPVKSEFVIDPDFPAAALRKSIVHEATHAAFYYGVRHPMRFENEGGAYVAEALFLRFQQASSGVPDDTTNVLIEAAGPVAENLIARRLKGGGADGPLLVDDKLWKILIAKIKATPPYKNKAETEENIADRTFEDNKVIGVWRVMVGTNPPDTFRWDWIYEFAANRSVKWQDRVNPKKNGQGRWDINAKKDRLVMHWRSGVVETLDAPPQAVQEPTMGGKTSVEGKMQKMFFTRIMA